MSDKVYVDRQLAIAAACDAADDWDGGYSKDREELIEKTVKTLKPADVVEVVRCKDCVCRNDIGLCCVASSPYWQKREDSFYCAYGERKGTEKYGG